jgi:hypothetical protein
MGLLLLGLDSFIVCLAVGFIVDGRSRLKLAALFGVADGVAFLIGAGLGWQLFTEGASTILTTGMLVALAAYLLVVAAGTQRVTARWVWLLPAVLVFDNLTYGLLGDHAAGSVLAQAGAQALSSTLLALVGLLAAGALRPVLEQRAVTPNRVAGGALLLAAAGLVLVG